MENAPKKRSKPSGTQERRVEVTNWETDTHNRRRIKGALARWGLAPDLSKAWEVHWMYPGCQVIMGYALPGPRCVAIYPRAVYEVDSGASEWWNRDTMELLPTVEKVKHT